MTYETDEDCGGSCSGCDAGEGCDWQGDCASQVCAERMCAEPTCDDAVANGGESDVDCGGNGCDPCGILQACTSGGQCETGFCDREVCTIPACADSEPNGSETDTDCGGGQCPKCAAGQVCLSDSDCGSGVCGSNGTCEPPSCTDQVRNGSETDVDCGGTCPLCVNGKTCGQGSDCESGSCVAGVCRPAQCNDRLRNGSETDTDCGGTACEPCREGSRCVEARDCASGVCTGEVCSAPACDDDVKNGVETDVDCGGTVCAACGALQRCLRNSDCESEHCSSAGTCTTGECSDGVLNGAETDMDCGGPECGGCAPGGDCEQASDCASQVCLEGTCQAARCNDEVRNGTETDTDCGGGSCGPCAEGDGCATWGDCASKICLGTPPECQTPTCLDGVRNGEEVDIDCAGDCDRCVAGQRCVAPEDCLSGVCAAGLCQGASCSDSLDNGSETDVDCGGSCGPCDDGEGCLTDNDCTSRVCEGGECAEPTCTDNVTNGDETGPDCGGTTCDPCTVADDCSPNPCQNGGTCIDVSGSSTYTCDCTGTGYEGTTCQTNVNDCAPNPCQNGGTCTDGVNNFTCDCTGTGYTGTTCQSNFNECVGNVCENGSACVDGINSYTCDCTGTGFTGTYCQTNVDDCNPDPCQHGGTCTDGVNDFTCDCTGTGYEGTTCQTPAAPTCDDTIQNQDEIDVDCGGTACGATCQPGDDCTVSADCESGVCDATCQAPTCSDGVMNGTEAGVDCGGNCAACEDVNNCGGPGLPCSYDHGTPSCVGGQCSMAQCDSLWDDCSADENVARDGCETNIAATDEHCGSCGNDCTDDYANAAGSCVSGGCVMGACDGGWGDCAGGSGDGCETDLTSDVDHCGACNDPCGTSSGTPSCSAGVCSMAGCNSGWDDCSADENVARDGCETYIQGDAEHCGNCTNDCTDDYLNADGYCSGGVCQMGACQGTFRDCTDDAGCETDVSVSTVHCGACNTPCSFINGTPSCDAGACSMSCASGHENCNQEDSQRDGCETDIDGDVNNCGACGNICAAEVPPHAAVSECNSGSCVYACDSGYLDCDGDLQEVSSNGCEVDLNTDVDHCGTCGYSCAVNAPSNTVVTECLQGECQYTCAAGFGDCDGQLLTNGCETDLDSSVDHCGVCFDDCGQVNGTALCNEGICSMTCSGGFADCSADENLARDGCETGLGTQTDCAFCGDACIGTCVGDICETCSDGLLNQDETDVDCGGQACGPTCDYGEDCSGNSDCSSDRCINGSCELPVCVSGNGIRVHYTDRFTDPTDVEARPVFIIHNDRGAGIDTADLEVRYWFTRDSVQDLNFICDYAPFGCGNVMGSFQEVIPARTGADYYLLLSFGSYVVGPGSDTGEIQTRFHKLDWSVFDETDDHSYVQAGTDVENMNVTVYENGTRVWGCVPE